jgi:V/A-type H+-transporting ATPase subunit D
MRDLIPTHSARLEIEEEHVSMEEGYRFLDEKRLVLAAELVKALRDYQGASVRYATALEHARAALVAAVARHGLEGLAVYPPLRIPDARLRVHTRSVLGVQVIEAHLDLSHLTEAWTAPNPSPEAQACRQAFLALWPLAVELAAIAGNLERLREDYRRTARRARALEDVLLPEIEETMTALALVLEDLDREDAVRVRYRGAGSQHDEPASRLTASTPPDWARDARAWRLAPP